MCVHIYVAKFSFMFVTVLFHKFDTRVPVTKNYRINNSNYRTGVINTLIHSSVLVDSYTLYSTVQMQILILEVEFAILPKAAVVLL